MGIILVRDRRNQKNSTYRLRIHESVVALLGIFLRRNQTKNAIKQRRNQTKQREKKEKQTKITITSSVMNASECYRRNQTNQLYAPHYAERRQSLRQQMIGAIKQHKRYTPTGNPRACCTLPGDVSWPRSGRSRSRSPSAPWPRSCLCIYYTVHYYYTIPSGSILGVGRVESTIVSEGFKGGTHGSPIMPRDVSLSDSKC